MLILGILPLPFPGAWRCTWHNQLWVTLTSSPALQQAHLHHRAESSCLAICNTSVVPQPYLESWWPLGESHEEHNEDCCNALGRGQSAVWTNHDWADREVSETASLSLARRGALPPERALAVAVFSQDSNRRNKKTFQFSLKWKMDAWMFFPSKTIKQTPQQISSHAVILPLP